MGKNETKFQEEALRESNKGVNTLYDNKQPTLPNEKKSCESPQPPIEAPNQAAGLIMSAAKKLIQASKLDPRLHDPIIEALSILRKRVHFLAEIDSEVGAEKDSGEGTVCEYTVIIKEITGNLIGDGEKDSKYLMEQIEKYKYHEYGIEIIKAISRIVYKSLPEEEQNKVSNILKNDAIYIEAVLTEAKTKLAEHNLDEAEKLILKILPDSNSFCSDKVSEYYDFRNFLEMAFFVAKYKPLKEIRQIPISYNEVFMLYAYLLVEKEDYDNAIRIIDLGIKRNPLHIDLLFEKASIYRILKKYDQSFQISLDCFDKAYRRMNIARCYRDFGYYFIENKKWEAAISCYLLSDNWVKSDKTKNELFYITQQTQKVIDQEYYTDHFEEILEKHQIPLGPNPLWIQIADYLGEKACADHQFEEAKFCYHVAYELTGDDSYHEKVLKINDELD